MDYGDIFEFQFDGDVLGRKAVAAFRPLCNVITTASISTISLGPAPQPPRAHRVPRGRPAIIITRCLSRRLSSAASGKERGRRRGDRRHRPLRGPIETDRTWDLGPVAVTRPRAKRHAHPPPPPEDRYSTQRGRGLRVFKWPSCAAPRVPTADTAEGSLISPRGYCGRAMLSGRVRRVIAGWPDGRVVSFRGSILAVRQRVFIRLARKMYATNGALQ